MGKATRSSDPIDLPGGITHGLTGYNYGCGCLVCRRSKTEAQRRFKDKRDGRIPSDMPTSAGQQEKLTRIEIANLGVDLSDEQQSLANLAIIHAKLVDTIEKEQRWHLLNATTKSLRETMKELRGTLPKRRQQTDEEEGDDDFAANLRGFGQP